jgi:hypothetical protein
MVSSGSFLISGGKKKQNIFKLERVDFFFVVNC